MNFSPYKMLSSKEVYRNRWISVHEDAVVLPNRKEGTYGVVETSGPFVSITAVTEQREIYLIRQYRYPTNEWGWELPAGGIEDAGQMLEIAQKELWEETGLTAQKWEEVAKLHAMPNILNVTGILYVAQELTEGSENRAKEEGISEIRKFSIDAIKKMIRSTEITDATTVTFLTHTFLFFEERNR